MLDTINQYLLESTLFRIFLDTARVLALPATRGTVKGSVTLPTFVPVAYLFILISTNSYSYA
jgi:hypothetical protein